MLKLLALSAVVTSAAGWAPTVLETTDQDRSAKAPVSRPSVVHDVQWETNLDAALAASKKTGKPVLLLQLMGKLDDEFC